MRDARHYPKEPATDLAGGALLRHYPDDNLNDGAAAAAAPRFFTVDNVPPCETWLGFIDGAAGRIHLGTSSNRALISYIAASLRSYAEDGVAVNPEMCLLWAHDRDAPCTGLLRTVGLLRSS